MFNKYKGLRIDPCGTPLDIDCQFKERPTVLTIHQPQFGTVSYKKVDLYITTEKVEKNLNAGKFEGGSDVPQR